MLFCNINRSFGCVSVYGIEAKSKRYVLRRLLKVATEVAERTNSGRLFQREGEPNLNALVPVLVLILGTEGVIPLFHLSEHDGRDVVHWWHIVIRYSVGGNIGNGVDLKS